MKIKVVILATSLVAINCLAGETLAYDPIKKRGEVQHPVLS